VPTVDAFLASGATALGLSLLFLFLLVTEQIVPKGRLVEAKEQVKECKDALKEALGVIKSQNDGVTPLLITVKELVVEVKTLLARARR
jgi:hypothetical protein